MSNIFLRKSEWEPSPGNHSQKLSTPTWLVSQSVLWLESLSKSDKTNIEIATTSKEDEY
jgi:hypothetical protein